MIQLPKKRLKAFIVAGCMSIAFLATGTFAWQSISQKVINQFEEEITPGARLHDDFNGLQNKDIYVENYGSLQEDVPIYARIQLKEYMEIGVDAGNFGKQDRDVTVVGSTEDKKIEYNDVTTWHTHEYKPTTLLDLEFRKYWDWELGNDQDTDEKYFMPTFNKNNQSLISDINGTLEGSDGDKTQGTSYDDYVVYAQGQTKTGQEEYYDSKNPDVPTKVEATHTTQKIEDKAKVISMQEWIALGKPIGEYWVYDSDGWAYYAKPIDAGKASGLLLNKVNAKKKPEEKYHYSIQAIGEFATAGDWSGFESITPEGKDLLDTIADLKPKAISIAPKDNKYHYTVKVGNSLTLEADVIIENGTDSPSEKEVIWQMEDESASHLLNGNVFRTTDASLAGKTYTVIMKSKLTPEVSDKIQVTILPANAESEEIIIGEDKKPYIYFGNNVYKRIEDDGTLSNYISAGNDKVIGNSDDLTNVVEVNPAHETFGKFFLKEEENLYKWMGADGFLGTSDDKYVISETNNWPENITDFVADEIRIKTEAGATEDIQIKIGTQTKFIAEVYFRGQLIADHEVIWSINGQSDTNTTISEDGVLSVGGNESVGRSINVIASSKQKPNKLTKHITITVVNLGYEDIPNVSVGSDTTVRIGNYDYYVLANDGYKALLWMKNSYSTAMYFGSSGSNWENSGVRQFLTNNISTFIPNNLMNKIIETELTTRYYTSYGTPLSTPSFVTTRDKLFLLSYEDLFGTSSDTGTLDRNDLYTANGKLGDAYNLSSNNQLNWLRTNYVGDRGYLLDNRGATSTFTYAIVNGASYYLRPAFWIQLPGVTNDTTDSVNP